MHTIYSVDVVDVVHLRMVADGHSAHSGEIGLIGLALSRIVAIKTVVFEEVGCLGLTLVLNVLKVDQVCIIMLFLCVVVEAIEVNIRFVLWLVRVYPSHTHKLLLVVLLLLHLRILPFLLWHKVEIDEG